MKLTKRQKIGAAVVAVGLVLLVLDRVLVLPQIAPAGQVTDSSEAPAELLLAAPTMPEPNTMPPHERLANHLDTLWAKSQLDLSQTKDPFVLPPSWRAYVDLPDRKPPDSDATAGFAKKHRLTSVMLSPTGSSALIDSRVLTIGEKLDGFELVAISQDSATFEMNGRQVVLKLAKDR